MPAGISSMVRMAHARSGSGGRRGSEASVQRMPRSSSTYAALRKTMRPSCATASARLALEMPRTAFCIASRKFHRC